jgi:hypothetical protein
MNDPHKFGTEFGSDNASEHSAAIVSHHDSIKWFEARQIAVAPLSLITVPSPNLMVAHPVLAQPFNFRRRSTS